MIYSNFTRSNPTFNDKETEGQERLSHCKKHAALVSGRVIT